MPDVHETNQLIVIFIITVNFMLLNLGILQMLLMDFDFLINFGNICVQS